MSDNRAIMDEIRRIVAEGDAIDVKTRDRLLLTAILDIYAQFDSLQVQIDSMKPAITFYRIGLYVATLLGASAIALMWGLLTGQVTLVFR
jgi:hypothetical protein